LETLNRTSRGGQRGDGNGNWPEVLTDSLTFVQPRDAVVSMFLKPLQFFLNTDINPYNHLKIAYTVIMWLARRVVSIPYELLLGNKNDVPSPYYRNNFIELWNLSLVGYEAM
jgi:hypothetical protein